MFKKILLATLIGASFASAPVASFARTVVITEAPPPPRAEMVPAARRGFVWAPGHWEWRRGHHVWARGHWIRERRGYRWHGENWSQRDGHWVMEPGRWQRGDRDGDGVPNRFDRAPNDPTRR